MIGHNAINDFLVAFHGCERRGETATLFLETRNGDTFATLRSKLPTSDPRSKSSPGKTFLGSARKKSPSTLRRDRERLEKFVKRKSLQETWHPTVTSTPAMTKQDLPVHSTPALDTKLATIASETVHDDIVDKVDHSDDENKSVENEKVEDASNLDWKMINKIIDKSLAKWHKENAEILDNSVTVVRKNENENDSSDNLEEAKIWAQNQKRGDRP